MPGAPPQSVTQLLRDMVRINSINPDLPGSAGAEAALADFLETAAEQWNLTTLRLPAATLGDQLLVSFEADPALPWLLFDSHLDTVSAEGMTIDPFGGVIDGDLLFGRGACDTKGTGAAMLWALKSYADQAAFGTTEPANNAAVLFCVDEEVAMRGLQHFLAHDLPGLGWRPWGVVVGEPTDMHPVVAHNGCTRWTLTTYGLAAHSSVPHEGRSAISAMVKVIEAIEARYAPSLTLDHPLTGSPVCSVNTIQGGSAFNIIPDRCTIEIDRRVTPAEDPAQVELQLAALLEQLHDVEFSLKRKINHPPLAPASSATRLLPAVKAVLHGMGLPTLAPGAPFATHAAYFAAAGLPTLVLGPGSPHKAHTKDEWVSVSAIERGVELYLRLMRYNPRAASAE